MSNAAYIREASDILLKAMLGSNALVQKWWNSPNAAFANKTPNAIFEIDPNAVYRYLTTHMEGNW